MHDSKLLIFIWLVERLQDARKPITFYNLCSFKEIARGSVFRYVIFCVMLGFLRKRRKWRGKMDVYTYTKTDNWPLLRKYAEHATKKQVLKDNRAVFKI